VNEKSSVQGCGGKILELPGSVSVFSVFCWSLYPSRDIQMHCGVQPMISKLYQFCCITILFFFYFTLWQILISLFSLAESQYLQGGIV